MKERAEIIFGLPFDEYLALEGLSNSALKRLKVSPWDFKYSTFVESKAMELGAGAHCFLLEPERFASEYKILPMENKNDIKAACKESGYPAEYLQWDKDKTPYLRPSELKSLHQRKKSLTTSELAPSLLKKGYPEVTIRYELDGILFKSRVDYLIKKDNLIWAADLKNVSLKANEAMTLKKLRYYFRDFGLHEQAALYRQGLQKVFPNHVVNFAFIMLENPDKANKKEKYSCVVCNSTEERLEEAAYEITGLVKKYRKYEKEGYPTTEEFLVSQQKEEGTLAADAPPLLLIN